MQAWTIPYLKDHEIWKNKPTRWCAYPLYSECSCLRKESGHHATVYGDRFPVQLTNTSVEFAIVNGLFRTDYADYTSQHTLARDICQMHDRDRYEKDNGSVRPFSKPTLESKAF